MSSSILFDRMALSAGAAVALAAGLFCSLAPAGQLAIACRILLVLAGVGSLVVLVVIGALIRRHQPERDDGYGEGHDLPGPLAPPDPFDLELRQLLMDEGALQ